MHNGIQLPRRPAPLLLDPLQLPLMRPLKNPITRNMEPLPLHILPHPPQHIPITHPRRLQQARQILDAEMAVRASMRLPSTGGVFGQDLLARERRIAPPPPRGVPADVPVRVPDVVAVLLVEDVVGVVLEALPPEEDAVVEGQPEAFEEERVLQPREVLEVRVLAQREVQVAHAEGEVRGEGVDGCGGDGGVEGGVRVRGVCVRRGEVFGEVGEDGGEAVVFVEAGEGARGELKGGWGQLVAFFWGVVDGRGSKDGSGGYL